jgi:hypothetical protein
MEKSLQYLDVAPGTDPPQLDHKPSRVIVVLDSEQSRDWQSQISRWLISIGCLYMMAWGPGCSSWDDSVDHANAEAFAFGPIPEECDAMTTWHESEPLKEVMWFAKNCAFHPCVELTRTLVLHVGVQAREAELLSSYNAA